MSVSCEYFALYSDTHGCPSDLIAFRLNWRLFSSHILSVYNLDQVGRQPLSHHGVCLC